MCSCLVIYLADRLVSLHLSPTCFYPSDVGTQQNIVSTRDFLGWFGHAAVKSVFFKKNIHATAV